MVALNTIDQSELTLLHPHPPRNHCTQSRPFSQEFLKWQPSKTAVSPRSLPLGTFREEERLRLGDRNSILIFLPPHRVSPFSRGVIFTRARLSLALLSPRKNENYSQSNQQIGSLSNDDDDHNDDFKKTIGLMIKTTALHVHHAFQYISLTSTARLRRETS